MTARVVLRLFLAAAFFAAGVAHLIAPEPFVAITPDWVPAPRQVVAATGVAELFGAAGLLWRRTRKAAGWALAAYAVCVFPANVRHALDAVPAGGVALGWAYHGPRLALQPVIVWACLWASGAIDWPFRARADRVRTS